MVIQLRKLGAVTFENYALISSDEILVAGGDAYEKLQSYTGIRVTSVCLFNNENRWYLFADLALSEDYCGTLDDEYVTRIEDPGTIQRLNALLYEA